MTLLVLFAILLVFVALGLPILLAIGLVGLGGMFVVPGVNPALFAQRIFSILDSFSLLALRIRWRSRGRPGSGAAV